MIVVAGAGGHKPFTDEQMKRLIDSVNEFANKLKEALKPLVECLNKISIDYKQITTIKKIKHLPRPQKCIVRNSIYIRHCRRLDKLYAKGHRLRAYEEVINT